MVKTKNLELASYIMTESNHTKVDIEQYPFPDKKVFFYVFEDMTQDEFNDISNEYYNSQFYMFMANRRRLLNMMADNQK